MHEYRYRKLAINVEKETVPISRRTERKLKDKRKGYEAAVYLSEGYRADSRTDTNLVSCSHPFVAECRNLRAIQTVLLQQEAFCPTATSEHVTPARDCALFVMLPVRSVMVHYG